VDKARAQAETRETKVEWEIKAAREGLETLILTIRDKTWKVEIPAEVEVLAEVTQTNPIKAKVPGVAKVVCNNDC
jgi:hypothetical protein